MKYHCTECDMGVKGLTCAKCDAPLKDDVIATPEGKKVRIACCPNGCGKIKSPQCCGHDMEVEMEAKEED